MSKKTTRFKFMYIRSKEMTDAGFLMHLSLYQAKIARHYGWVNYEVVSMVTLSPFSSGKRGYLISMRGTPSL